MKNDKASEWENVHNKYAPLVGRLMILLMPKIELRFNRPPPLSRRLSRRAGSIVLIVYCSRQNSSVIFQTLSTIHYFIHLFEHHFPFQTSSLITMSRDPNANSPSRVRGWNPSSEMELQQISEHLTGRLIYELATVPYNDMIDMYIERNGDIRDRKAIKSKIYSMWKRQGPRGVSRPCPDSKAVFTKRLKDNSSLLRRLKNLKVLSVQSNKRNQCWYCDISPSCWMAVTQTPAGETSDVFICLACAARELATCERCFFHFPEEEWNDRHKKGLWLCSGCKEEEEKLASIEEEKDDQGDEPAQRVAEEPKEAAPESSAEVQASQVQPRGSE